MKSDRHPNDTWDGRERRVASNDRRRQSHERRALAERRHDKRTETYIPRRSLKSILRMLTNARLGVDRRKGDRRYVQDRRSQKLSSLLSPEELADLLK